MSAFAERRPVPAEAMTAAREAQRAWCARPVQSRLRVLRAARRLLADRAAGLAAAVPAERRASPAETLTAEVLPLIDACRFLERRAAAALRPRRIGRRGRPFWLAGVRSEIHREPFGTVLVIGPSNYPLLLPGVQTVQALAAGNAVVLKPGTGGVPAAWMLRDALTDAGLPAGLLAVLDDSIEAGIAAIDAGPDLVLLTGSVETGRSVLRRLAGTTTPAIVELSGCDAAFVLDDADLDLVVRALVFGTRLNGGATCIAPRRVFVSRKLAGDLEARLGAALAAVPEVTLEPAVGLRLAHAVAAALAGGARLAHGAAWPVGPVGALVLADVTPEMLAARSDIFAPLLMLMPFDDERSALQAARECPYSLGASVFGEAGRARAFAARVEAGSVVVNDLIVPTADPRLPFGGRGASGFGVTRGVEGLLALTRCKCIAVRRGPTRHLDPVRAGEERLIEGAIRLVHGSAAGRAAWLRDCVTRWLGRPGRGAADTTVARQE